jgi:single-strand DNA-binding protein
MNQIALIGRTTKDPELRYTASGTAVCTFTLAVDRDFKGKDGQKETDFINVVVWQKPAENTAKYLSKGKLCAVSGRLQTRNYEGNDGKRVYVTEVVAEQVKFLEPKTNSTLTDGAQHVQPFDNPFDT